MLSSSLERWKRERQRERKKREWDLIRPYSGQKKKKRKVKGNIE
jgi:hypothetical protein